jgi:hypothetical protein
MIRWLAWAVPLLVLPAIPAAAQRWPDEQCVLDPNLAPCLQSRADNLVRAFGVHRIEEHRDAGDEVLRIFYEKDGYIALIALTRTPGHEPTASVYFPPAPGGGRASAPMRAPIPQDVWDQAFYRAAYADRSLAPVPADPEVQTVCIHPWNYVFEASVPAQPAYGQRARVRRHSIDSCNDAPLLYFAADLQRLILPLFPACDVLDASLYGNAVQRLVRCQRLSGDRLAAARIMNLAHPFQVLGGSEDPHALDDLFASDSAIDWNGNRRQSDHRNPALFWRARLAEDDVNGFQIDSVEGQSRDRVRVTGHLFRDRPGTNDGTQSQARFEQIWARNWSGMQVASVTVGPWQARRPR